MDESAPPSPAAMRGTDHLRSLTSMRFFAAFMVVLLHIGQRFGPVSDVTIVAGFGYTGVTFFFVLSGFILTWTHRVDDTAKSFYRRRFARVYPLHVLTMILAALVALAVGASSFWPAAPMVATLSQAWFPGSDIKYAFNGPSWSLSCEFFFYLLFPWLVARLSRITRFLRAIVIVVVFMVIVAAICVVAFPTDQLGNLLYTLPAYRLGEFLVGICLALAMRHGWRPRISLANGVTLTIALYAVLAVATNFALGDLARLPYFVADLWMLPGWIALIVAGASGDIDGRRGWIRSRTLVVLGQWSFALYLVHELALKLGEPLVDNLNLPLAVAASVIIVFLAIAASGALYRWFERPVEQRIKGRSRLPVTSNAALPTPSVERVPMHLEPHAPDEGVGR